MNVTYIEYDVDSDEYYFKIPPDILYDLGWDVGDEIVWTISEDNNTVILRKKKENEDE